MNVKENMYSIITVSCVFAFVFCAWRVLNFMLLKPRKLEKCLRAQGLCGNSYKPIFGDFKEFAMMIKEAYSKPINISDDTAPRVLPLFVETIKKFGSNSFVWLGPTPSIIIKDPEIMREVFLNNNVFHKPANNPLAILLGKGLFTSEGDKWTKHRKIINPAFHLEKIKLMLPAIHLSANEMLSKWEKSVSAEGSSELDVWQDLHTLTSDAISRTAFGSNYNEGRRIFELQKEQAHHVTALARTLPFPGKRLFPSKTNRRLKEIEIALQATIRDIIHKRVKAMKEGEARKDDLLGILLESNFKEIEHPGNNEIGMSIKDVIEECKLFYYAGQVTTSTLLVWTLILLSKHQDWQSRAREEVLQVFGRKEIDFQGLNQLKIVTMILNEVLRLYPPIVFTSRRIDEETKIGRFSFPAGVLLSLQIMLLHHDSEIWGADANGFNPERFSEGVSNATKGQISFFPFGWGPRTCIGQNFAMTEAKLAVAMILQRFSFELSPSYAHAPYTMVTIQPQHGAHLVLHKL